MAYNPWGPRPAVAAPAPTCATGCRPTISPGSCATESNQLDLQPFLCARQGRYQQVKDNLRVKEVRVDGYDARFIVCHNPEQAERDRQQRDQAIARIQAELARIAE